jgi:hypothetical protein
MTCHETVYGKNQYIDNRFHDGFSGFFASKFKVSLSKRRSPAGQQYRLGAFFSGHSVFERRNRNRGIN